METLQSSSPRGVLMYYYICGNSFNLTQYRKESVWLQQWIAFALGGIVVGDDVRCYMG